MKCYFCPLNDAHFTLDDQVNSRKWQATGLNFYKFPTCSSPPKNIIKSTSVSWFLINDDFWTLVLEGNCAKKLKKALV